MVPVDNTNRGQTSFGSVQQKRRLYAQATPTPEEGSAPVSTAGAPATGVGTTDRVELRSVPSPSDKDPLKAAARDFVAYLSGFFGGSSENFRPTVEDPDSLAGYVYSQMLKNGGDVDISDPRFRQLLVSSIYDTDISGLSSRQFATDRALDYLFGDESGKLEKGEKINLENLRKRVAFYGSLLDAQKQTGGTGAVEFLKATVIVSASKGPNNTLQQLGSKLYNPGAINGGPQGDFYQSGSAGQRSVLNVAISEYYESNKSDANLRERLNKFNEELAKSDGNWETALKKLDYKDKEELSRFLNAIYADRFVDRLSKECKLPIEELTGREGVLKRGYNSLRNLVGLTPIGNKYDKDLLGQLTQYGIFEYPMGEFKIGKKDLWDKVGEFFGFKRRITAEEIKEATKNIGVRTTPSNATPAPN